MNVDMKYLIENAILSLFREQNTIYADYLMVTFNE